jgi:hypothetical protein
MLGSCKRTPQFKFDAYDQIYYFVCKFQLNISKEIG